MPDVYQSSDASKNIINIINAAAEAHKAQTDLQKQVLLKQVGDKMDLAQKQSEFQQQMANIPQIQDANNKLNGIDNPTAQTGDGRGMGGVANSGTPTAQGGSPMAQLVNPGATPPMSMVNPAQQPANDASSQGFGVTAPQPTPQVQPQQPPPIPAGVSIPSPIGQPLPPPRGNITIGDDGRPVYKQLEPKDKWYAGVYAKWRSGQQLSLGENKAIQDYFGLKEMSGNAFDTLGIDTVNQSPNDIGQELLAKNPGKYHSLEAIKDGRVNITGRTSKDMKSDMDAVQTIWPGTDLTVVKSRIDVRKDFTSGPTSKIVDALNTSLLHGDTAADLIKKVNNRGLLIGNTIGNILRTQTNDPDLLALKDTIEKYNRESAKAIAGSGQVYVDELKSNNDSLNAAQSVDGALSVINNRTKLFSGRTTPLAERWARTFGEDSPAPVLGPHAQKLLMKNGFQYDPKSGEISQGGGNAGGGAKLYGGISVADAKAQGYTGWDSDNNKWVK